MEKPKLLLVDDVEDIRKQMRWTLADEYEVFEAEDRTEAMELFETHRMPLVSLDLGLPPDSNGVEEGFRLLDEILEIDADAKVVVITGQEQRSHALRAVSLGAYDFFTKPIQIDELHVVLRRGRYVYDLETENRKLHNDVSEDSFQGIVGFSESMQNVFKSIRRVAGSDAEVLVDGESGTGKELVARAVHRLSARSEGPFVPINCGAIPENLLESELFGYEKGAFTGAHARRQGRIELAHGGTLFLDEVGELSPSLQVKLLRFLQEHRLERIGGRQEIEVDVRVIAATNADLEKAMRSQTFREDLYFRLAVVRIPLPALRERGEDVEVLARVFLERYALENGRGALEFDREALAAIHRHSWPGNVRELENRIKRAVIMADGRKITTEDLELATPHALGGKALSLKRAREEVERELISNVLWKHNGNVTRTAAELQVSRPTLYELMQKLGISRGKNNASA
ncbi:MAG TPA: PEP-CTERM-box response regulator transcription factor [Vicinamibacteria bacterium]|nr:PEP-CTERM-box response regulator transcription factor [Vicinamibacteria bacterium]